MQYSFKINKNKIKIYVQPKKVTKTAYTYTVALNKEIPNLILLK